MKPSTAIACALLQVDDISTTPATTSYKSLYKDLSSDASFDPEGKVYTDIGEVTRTDDGTGPPANPTEYEGIDNYWYCQPRTSEVDEFTSAYCNLFMPKVDAAENGPTQFRFTGDCTDCTLHYIGYDGMAGGKISPAITTISWMFAASGIVAAGTAALASLLLL